MDIPLILRAIAERSAPGTDPVQGVALLVGLALALLLVAPTPLWRVARLGVTLVHELGHALVGILVGRRFTGFVVSADMSGHAVTVGPRRGIGRVLSTAAGYPAPAVLGLLLVLVARTGWAGTALGVIVVVLLLSLVVARSVTTVLAVLGVGGVTAAVWWFGGPGGAAVVTLALGVFLLLGAWRHLVVVATTGGGDDDPGQLARLTPLPAAAWTASMGLLVLACTVGAVALILPGVPGPAGLPDPLPLVGAALPSRP